MYKKFLSAILLGAFTIASTSTFVSCKDYDDDIKNLQTQIDENKASAALGTTLTALQNQVSALKASLEAKDAELASLISSASEAGTANTNKITEILAEQASLSSRINSANEQIDAVKALLDEVKAGTVSQEVLEAKATEIYAAVEAVKTDLGSELTTLSERLAKGLQDEETARKAVAADVAQQQAALSDLIDRVAAIEEVIFSSEAKQGIVAQVEALQKEVEEAGLNQMEGSVSELEAQVRALAAKVDAFTPGASTLNVFQPNVLRSLVFIPDTYYYGIEATSIKTLLPKWYTNMKELQWNAEQKFSYIDKDENAYWGDPINKVYKSTTNNRVEDVGVKGKTPSTKEDAIATYQPATYGKVTDHERYTLSASTISITVSAEAKYHMNPSTADMSNAEVSIIDDQKTYTTRVASAEVSAATKEDGSKAWTAENGKLTVPLWVNKPQNIQTVTLKVDDDGYVAGSGKDGVTIFAAQAHLGDTTITSDYAALIVEEVKDLRLSHVKKNQLGTREEDFIQTKMFNQHCGECELNKIAGKNMGMHLFGSIGEARDYVTKTVRIDSESGEFGEGQDIVKYDEDIDLTALIETHYTNEKGQHVKATDKMLNDNNFSYRFFLTTFKTGAENTNNSAHAAIYVGENGHYYLHPQDPVAGGLVGKPYDPAKATEVVVNRVPMVRVELVVKDKDDNFKEKVVDYGYLPIRISKDKIQPIEQPTITFDRYKDDSKWNLIRWNNCYLPNDKGFTFTTDWRKTEEDLMSHPDLKNANGERIILDRVTFDNNYTPDGMLSDLNQYVFVKDNDGYHYYRTATPGTYSNTAKADVSGNPNPQNGMAIGQISYIKRASITGTETSILEWTVTAAKIQKLADAGVTSIVRAIKLNSADKYNYPDMYIIFETGVISVENKTVKGDAELTKHIIKQYWYTDGSNDELVKSEDADEIHANTITPEENKGTGLTGATAWKPVNLDDRFADVFYNNMHGTNHHPKGWIKFTESSPFNTNNLVLDFVFDESNNNRTFFGYQNSQKNDSVFTIKTNYSGALDADLAGNKVTSWSETGAGKLGAGKYLYAQQGTKVQIIATISEWDDAMSSSKLDEMKIALNRNSSFARALLNYVSPNQIWSIKKNDVKAKDGSALIDHILNATVALKVVSFKHAAGGETINCPLELENNKFDVRFLRPLSIDPKAGPTIQDASEKAEEGTKPEEGDYGQKVVLSDLINKYIDWRNLWGANYETYYAAEGETVIRPKVDKGNNPTVLGLNLSDLDNVYTDITGTRKKLNEVHGDLEFQVDHGDEYVLWYRNNSSTVNEFHVWIPVVIEHYWGEMYTEITITVQKTRETKRK